MAQDTKSSEITPAIRIASLPKAEMERVIMSLSESEAEEMIYDWKFWARSEQLPPDWAWYVWLLLSGRGGGKTRTGSELVIEWAHAGFTPIALVAATAADVRDTMVEAGESSILKVSPPWFMPHYEPSKRRLTWPNGVYGTTYSGDEPDQLRGPEHQKAWADEIAKYKYPQDTWDNLMFGLRSGSNPQTVVTTTPRPIKLIKDLIADERTAVTYGHTMDNRANLAPDFIRYVQRKYGGTRLGRQELAGEVLDDNPNAIWSRDQIDDLRVKKHPDLIRVVVGVDPQGADKSDAADTGIVVAGIAKMGGMIHGFVLADLTLSGSPGKWASEVVAGYHSFKADRVIGEVNFGGDMVESTVKTADPQVSFKKVHASRGKVIRAEPVSALYEQGRMHHVGFFPELEDQMCEWVPGNKSPDRLDALVWAVHELILLSEGKEFMVG